MSESKTDAPGYETFTWCGQTRYRCKRNWPNGARCEFDTYDLHLMAEHERAVHKAAKPLMPQMPTLFDADGRQITRQDSPEEGEPGEAEGFSFAPDSEET